MTKVYYTRITSFREKALFKTYLNKVEEGRKAEILRTRSEETRVRSLTAGSLLHEVLCRELSLPKTSPPFQILKEFGGKPYLKEYPSLHFNLSHSGDYVCCAVGKEPVGVDLQKYTVLRHGLAERFFTKEDNKALQEAGTEDKEALFFRIWSIRESYVKLTGKGMQGFSDFTIDWEQGKILPNDDKEAKAWFEEKEIFPGYASSLCVGNKGKKAEWEEIRFGHTDF